MHMHIKLKGNFKNTDSMFASIKRKHDLKLLDKYGKEGVEALRSVTPIQTGTTANSWYYKVDDFENVIKLSFCNSNIVDGVSIAVILQYGHATKSGGWVEGRDYINPVIIPIFDKIADKAWEEMIE